MKTVVMKATLAVIASALTLLASSGTAQAFWGHHRQAVTTAYAVPAVPVTTAMPVVVARPIVVAQPYVAASPVVTTGYAPVGVPVTNFYAPATTANYASVPPSFAQPTYAQPTTTFYAPTAAVGTPVTSFYAPAQTIFVAPTTTLFAPAGVVPGTIITRRPRVLVP